MPRETRFILPVLAIWFGAAVLLGLTGTFTAASAATIALTVWTLAALALLAWWKISTVRQSANAVDLSWVIGLHLTRFVGIYFVVLCQSGELSCAFAVPAGAGDIAVALGAALLLFARSAHRGWRKAIGIWNFFGLLDILLVVFRAYRVGLADWAGMAPLRALPLMLLPTFLVPLIIASHIVIFARLTNRMDTEHG